MDRRTFIKLGAMAATALGLPIKPAETPAVPSPQLLGCATGVEALRNQSQGLCYITIDNTGNYEGFYRDSQMYAEFARFEFQQLTMMPNHWRLVNLEAPGEADAL